MEKAVHPPRLKQAIPQVTISTSREFPNLHPIGSLRVIVAVSNVAGNVHTQGNAGGIPIAIITTVVILENVHRPLERTIK
jgi:hypothetical protein